MSDSSVSVRRADPGSLLRAFARLFKRQKMDGAVLDAVARIGLPADIDPVLAPATQRSHAARCVLQAIRAVHGGRIPADTASIATVIAPFAPQAPIRRSIESISGAMPRDICFRPIRKALEKLEEGEA